MIDETPRKIRKKKTSVPGELLNILLLHMHDLVQRRFGALFDVDRFSNWEGRYL
jgi:hypothetical protein